MSEALKARETGELMQRVLYEVKRIVVGQDHFLERVLVAILSQGHLLVEGVPGLAKTLTVNTLAKTMRGTFKRIQFTPDLLPADLVGTRMYNQKSGEFSTVLGPVFANLLLADEINRAPAKVQSALLEVMQERQVTIAGQSHKVPEPFLVMATQNPIETEGTYPLPEAQVDRFMMKVLVGYPNEEEEFVIVERVTGAATTVSAVCSTEQLTELQQQCRKIYVDPNLIQYAVKLVAATRRPEQYGLKDMERYLTFGASPRATISLIEGARALAFLRGARLRAARGRDRPRARRAAAPAGAELRGAVGWTVRRRADHARAAGDPGAGSAAREPCSRGGGRLGRRSPGPLPPARRRRPTSPPEMARVPGAGSTPSACCGGSNGPCCGGSTACCRATTGRCSAASAWISPTCANTSCTTTCATSTGT